MKAYNSSLNQQGETTLKAAGKRLQPVTEAVFYQVDFPIFLKEKFEGCTVADVAKLLDIDEQSRRQRARGAMAAHERYGPEAGPQDGLRDIGGVRAE